MTPGQAHVDVHWEMQDPEEIRRRKRRCNNAVLAGVW